MELFIPISAIVLKFILPPPNAFLALLGTIYMVVAFNFYPFLERDGIVLINTVLYAPVMFIALWIIYAIIDLIRSGFKWLRSKRT